MTCLYIRPAPSDAALRIKRRDIKLSRRAKFEFNVVSSTRPQERLELVDHKLRRPTIAPPPPYLREIPLMTSTCYYDRMRTTQIKTQLRADVDVASFFFFASASARASEASARPRDRVRGPFEPVDFPTECSLAAPSSSSSPPSTGQSDLNWNGASVQHISSPNLRNQRIRTCYKQRCRDAAREPGARAESANVAFKFVESRSLRKAQVRLQFLNRMQTVTIRFMT